MEPTARGEPKGTLGTLDLRVHFASLQAIRRLVERLIERLGLRLVLPFACRLILPAAALFAQSENAQAKTFMNSYVSFELNSRWNCTSEMTEWICRSEQSSQAPAIIILTAKEAGPQDSLSAYEAHLKKQKNILSRTGQPLKSTVYQVQQETINLQPWVNGFHFSSEVVNYYTRYLATVKNGVGILVTFSAHRLKYTDYSADFFHAIQSLNVLVTKSARKWDDKGGGDIGQSGGSLDSIFPMEPGGGESGADGDGGGFIGKTKGIMGLTLIGVAIGLYLVAKRKPKTKNKPRRK